MSSRRNPAQHWDTCFAQDVLDDIFAQPRRVVVKMQMVGFLVEAELLQAIRVRKAAESAELLRLQFILELVRDRHERHAGIIAKARPGIMARCGAVALRLEL
jgi:hypothetical protein